MKKGIITRRDFIRVAAAAPFAGAVSPLFKPTPAAAPPQGKTRVVLIRDRQALDAAGNPEPEVIQKMLDDSLAALLGEKNSAAAWKRIIAPTDTVGIKTNVWTYLNTTSAVERALKRRVLDAGVAEDRIAIDDRGVRRNPVFQKATALINARPARTHYWSGMGGCIKNMIMFVPQPADYHGDSCADLATIWSLPEVKGKVKLNILLMLTPLFQGVGPHHYSKEYIWPYQGILVSADPVAVDSIGIEILQAKRRLFFGEEKPLQPPAHHVVYAETRHRLGVADRAKIELVKIGWKDEILI